LDKIDRNATFLLEALYICGYKPTPLTLSKKKNKKVTLVGFGTFPVSKRKLVGVGTLGQ
jgi:hypothetical protein